MALVTIRILDGPERGKAFHQITTPVSVGREEGNFIQLNDERISRYHLKIHENEGAILLTDLQSTNGTRVNGEAVQVWQLRPGDLISVGRSVLVFGSTDEIAKRLALLGHTDPIGSVPMGADGEGFRFLGRPFDRISGRDRSSELFEIEIFRGVKPVELAPLHLLRPPVLPHGLSARQTAQLSEFLQYVHLRLRYLVSTVQAVSGDSRNSDEKSDEGLVTLSAAQWQNLLDLYDRIAQHLNTVSEP